MSDELSKLEKRYPLSDQWKLEEPFEDTLTIGRTCIRMFGVTARNRNKQVVTGSAADIDSLPTARAYFELLERASVLEAEGRQQDRFCAFSRLSNEFRVVSRDRVFLDSYNTEILSYSKSNGVALYTDVNIAAGRALAELIERDRILRSWFGGIAPSPCHPSLLELWSAHQDLNKYFDLECYFFNDSSDRSGMKVAAVFGFPLNDELPFVFGLGSDLDETISISRAMTEFIQRMAFLWGESINGQPLFSPTPGFHQEYFLSRGSCLALRKWLSGEHQRQEMVALLQSKWMTDHEEVLYVDLTPKHLSKTLHVIKALSHVRIPLIFGDGYRALSLFGSIPASYAIHPVA